MITSSGTKVASPSTMTSASAEAANTMFRSLSAISLTVGFRMNWPLMRPMRPPATASAKGRGDSMTAAEAAVMESTSDSFSWSEEMTLASTCTSSGRPLGNNGRIGRSMRRETRVSRSDGRPISRRKKLPGIRPAAYMRSEYSTVSGKKPRSKSRGCEQTVTSTTVPPHWMVTEPWACVATRPVSRMISLPPMVAETRVGAFLKLMVNPFLFGKETPGTISIQTSILFAETPSHDGLRLMTWKGGAQGSPRKRTYLRSPSFSMRAR